MAADGLSDEMIEELREAFNLFDRQQDGTINSRDLHAAMKSLGQNPSEEETRKLVALNDADGSGTIDFPEFLSLISKRQREMLENEEALKDAFNVFDKDGSGLLNKKTFNDFLRKTGDGGLSDQQLDNMIAAIPYDKDGKIGHQEFVDFVMNAGKDLH